MQEGVVLLGENNKVVLKAENILKVYPNGVVANKDVNLEVYEGEIHALIGENGSGKSTLMSLVSGSQKADTGTMTYLGEEYIPRSLIDASNRHICILIQETGTISGLSVAENIFLGKESRFGTGPIIRARKMNKAAQELLDQVEQEKESRQLCWWTIFRLRTANW